MMKFDVIMQCKKELEVFKEIVDASSNFEPKGIFNSELLLLTTIIKRIGIKHLIESGRARGQSTEIIARFSRINGIQFDSIEFDQNSPDAEVAIKRLEDLKKDVTLHYGDSFEIIPKVITHTRPTALLIDGPKGFYALKLGIETMQQHQNIKAVFFHDVHNDAPPRKILNKYFVKGYFSDYKDFVEEFKYMDHSCWKNQSSLKSFSDWAPYTRDGERRQSYSATLGVILQDDSNMYEKALIEIYYEINQRKKVSRRVFSKIKNQVKKIIR